MEKSLKLNNVKIFTSYFDKKDELLRQGFKNFVSIAGKCPDDFLFTQLNNIHCEEYKKLAPKYSWWKEWHDKKLSNEWYIEKYYETVLSKLNVDEVFKELTKDGNYVAILLCWEKPELFCHRHVVAHWFKNAGYECVEL